MGRLSPHTRRELGRSIAAAQAGIQDGAGRRGFPRQPFVITLPKHSDPFGNPQIDPVPRAEVPQFYAEFYNKPSAVNHGHTINGYWMEQSRGLFGITQLDAFGPYRMPKHFWEYGLNEMGQNMSTPTGEPANGNLERDADAAWRADKGTNISADYPDLRRRAAHLRRLRRNGRLAGIRRNEIRDQGGHPGGVGQSQPQPAPLGSTRYVAWTSWLAGAQHWGLSSVRQGENSGTITHELGHFAFGIGDNNNNPYIQPYRRVGSGPWDMMDRGSFNGPGGPHRRWVVPATQGAAMPAGLMLRNRIINGFITNDQILRLNRDGLAQSGLAVATVTARAVAPNPASWPGSSFFLTAPLPTTARRPTTPPATPFPPAGPSTTITPWKSSSASATIPTARTAAFFWRKTRTAKGPPAAPTPSTSLAGSLTPIPRTSIWLISSGPSPARPSCAPWPTTASSTTPSSTPA